ncbi:MAG: hypothetical protein HQL37_16425 [Alphaproteobacteria bacterium]|nr:hypothetical protein [Alphaproteobacteria bacterium]
MKRVLAMLAVFAPALAAAQNTTVNVGPGWVQVQAPTPPQIQAPTPPTMPDMPVLPSPAMVQVQGSNVQVMGAGPGNSSSVSIGSMGADVSSQGVSVLNGEVYIDGEHVAKDATSYKSKSGQKYVIDRKGGGVSVRTE